MTLEQWMTENGVSDAQLAARLSVTRPCISKIRRRVRSPSLTLAVRLSEITNLPVATFDLKGA